MVSRNTEWHFFSGKAKWARLITPDLEYKNWNVTLYLNDDSYKRFMELKEKKGNVNGILNEIKKDEDGYSVMLKRDIEKWGTQLTPPEIMDAEGKPWKGELIGNGSDLTVKVECYRYEKHPRGRGEYGRAIRLAAVRVDNLIPFERREMTGTQLQQIKGLDEQPKQLF